jgi:hypothetical protein
MPKIERSVAYTFDAYSGGLQPEPLGEFSFFLLNYSNPFFSHTN